MTTFSVPLTWTAPLSLCPIYLKLLVHVLSVVQKRWSIAQWLNLLEEGTNNYFPYIFTKILYMFLLDLLSFCTILTLFVGFAAFWWKYDQNMAIFTIKTGFNFPPLCSWGSWGQHRILCIKSLGAVHKRRRPIFWILWPPTSPLVGFLQSIINNFWLIWQKKIFTMISWSLVITVQ